MTRSPQHPTEREQPRIRIALAVITGVLSGVTRAVTGWLLDHLTIGN